LHPDLGPDAPAHRVPLRAGYEVVYHPWIAFKRKTPLLKIAGTRFAYLTHVVNGQEVPTILDCMRVDDEVLLARGPIFYVRRGNGPYWPETWHDTDLVYRVGYSVISSLFWSK